MTDHHVDDGNNWEDFAASLDHEEEDDTARRYGEGPPVNSLAWPTPTLFQAELITVRACDHRSNAIRTLDNVLVKQSRDQDRAYLIRKKICRTLFGSVRMGVVLRRRTRRRTSSEDEDADDDEIPWISTEELVAVKVSSWQRIRQLQGKQLEDPVREVAALQLVGNSYLHIVGCHEVLQDAKYLYTVMPYYFQGTNLHGRLFSDPTPNSRGSQEHDVSPDPRNEEEARTIFRQLLKGLLELQRKGIFHRDISLDNLLISKTNNELKIVDLGMSLRVPYEDPCNQGCITDASEGTVRRLMKKQAKGGRLMYLAPEMLNDKEPFDGFAVDLWAAGVILFVLCVGLAPFKFADSSDKRYAKISSGGLKSLLKTIKVSLSPEAMDLMQNMLWENPRRRLSLAEVIRHPWAMGQSTVVSSKEVAGLISSEASIGSVCSTEPTQDADNESLKESVKATSSAELSLQPDEETIPGMNPETRESASESGRESFVGAVHQVTRNMQKIGPKLMANAQQVGPRIINNAQRIGPKLKNAVANVHSHPSRHRPEATNSHKEGAKSDNSLSPTRTRTPTKRTASLNAPQFFSKLKTVIPQKVTPTPSPAANAGIERTQTA